MLEEKNNGNQWHSLFSDKEVDTIVAMKMFGILKKYYEILCEVEYMPPLVYLGFVGEYVYEDYFNKLISNMGEDIIIESDGNYFLEIPDELQEIIDLKLLGRNAFQIASFYFLKDITGNGTMGEFDMDFHLGRDIME